MLGQEPTPPNNPLLKLDNVVLWAHFAGPTWDNHVARFRNGFDNVERVARGEDAVGGGSGGCGGWSHGGGEVRSVQRGALGVVRRADLTTITLRASATRSTSGCALQNISTRSRRRPAIRSSSSTTWCSRRISPGRPGTTTWHASATASTMWAGRARRTSAHGWSTAQARQRGALGARQVRDAPKADVKDQPDVQLFAGLVATEPAKSAFQ